MSPQGGPYSANCGLSSIEAGPMLDSLGRNRYDFDNVSGELGNCRMCWANNSGNTMCQEPLTSLLER